ncbi:hypothetical protein IJ182_02055 [bacterium]|nr:hypothetical protein [bacterium]
MINIVHKPPFEQFNFTSNNIYTTENKTDRSSKIKAGIGALVGMAIPLAITMKQKKIKNPLKMEYGLQDMLILSASSVAGGVMGGMLGTKSKEQRKHKLKEGVFQFLNAAIPTWIIGGVLKLPETSTKYNNVPMKVFSVVGGLVVGMFGAAEVSNLIFDPTDKEPDRKLTFKDCLVNADDALGALTLAKLPIIQNLHMDTILPAIYAYCGYRAGKSN